jgi:hypothetical protein
MQGRHSDTVGEQEVLPGELAPRLELAAQQLHPQGRPRGWLDVEELRRAMSQRICQHPACCEDPSGSGEHHAQLRRGRPAPHGSSTAGMLMPEAA